MIIASLCLVSLLTGIAITIVYGMRNQAAPWEILGTLMTLTLGYLGLMAFAIKLMIGG